VSDQPSKNVFPRFLGFLGFLLFSLLWASPFLFGLYLSWSLAVSEPMRLRYSRLIVVAMTYSLVIIWFSGRRLARTGSGSWSPLAHAVWNGVVASFQFGALLFLPLVVFVPIYFLNRGLPMNAIRFVQHFSKYALYIISLAPAGCAAGVLYYLLVGRRANCTSPKR
jgi:hypothetical protein